jgi:hypothetical protein
MAMKLEFQMPHILVKLHMELTEDLYEATYNYAIPIFVNYLDASYSGFFAQFV